MISSKHISKITIALMSVVLILCVVALAFSDKLSLISGNTGYSMEYQNELFDTNEILTIDIIIDNTKWNEMLENAKQENYYECDVVINGTTFRQVGIRPKGNTSLSSIANDPDNDRYSFKIEFDQFIDGQTCYGLDKLVLNNNFSDTTNMKEAIFYDMFQYLDADASLYNYAKITVNNEYWGVYLALEAIEDSFMLRNYGTEKGFLYKPDSMNHNDNNGGQIRQLISGQKNMEQNRQTTPEFENNKKASGDNVMGQNTDNPQTTEKTNKKTDGKVVALEGGAGRAGRGGRPGSMGSGGNLNYTDDNLESYTTIWDGQVNDSSDNDHKRVVEALKNVHSGTNIEKYIDIDQVLKYMAVHNFSVNNDSLSGTMAHNYYLYESNGKIRILPWDYNLAFGGMKSSSASELVNYPIDSSWNATELFDFVLEDEKYKALYHKYYNELVEEYLYGGKFDETYNRIRTQIDSLVEADPNAMYSYEEYVKGAETFYKAVMLRAESIKGQLAGNIPSTEEGQREESSMLIDATQITISDMGSFNGGGKGGSDRDVFGKNSQRAGRNNTAEQALNPPQRKE